MSAYYNDFDPFAAERLRKLIAAGHIAQGDVDDRSILDVNADDLIGYKQCHFFSGIGGWSYALRLAGVSDDSNVWTGSAPCQPFSSAGKQHGKDDERHLGPTFIELVVSGQPDLLFGEQVSSSLVFGRPASKVKRNTTEELEWCWFDDISQRLEDAHYAVAASDISAASVGAHHIRQRCYFGAAKMGDADYSGLSGLREPIDINVSRQGRSASRFNPSATTMDTDVWGSTVPGVNGAETSLFNPTFDTRTDSHGLSGRMGRLRGYGNAIVPQAGAIFVKSFWEATKCK